MQIRYRVDQITAACQHVVGEFDESCRGFWGPSRKEINGKVCFLCLVATLRNLTPDEAFLQLCDFCNQGSGSSTLIKILEEKLFLIAEVQKPEYNHAERHIYGEKLHAAHQEFECKVARIRRETRAGIPNGREMLNMQC